MGSSSEKCQQICKDINALSTDFISENLFLQKVFQSLERGSPNDPRGLFIHTKLLKDFYLVLTNSRNQQLQRKHLNEVIQAIYVDSSAEAMKYSYLLIQPDIKKNISLAQFQDYINKCIDFGMQQVFKKQNQPILERGYQQWYANEREIIQQHLTSVFENRKRKGGLWSYSDFSGWVGDRTHWTVNLEIGQRKYRIPLVLHALFFEQ